MSSTEPERLDALEVSLIHEAAELFEAADHPTLLRLAKSFVRVVEIIGSVYDLRHLLELIMRESERAVDAETSSLLLYDTESNDLAFEIALGPKGDEIRKIRLPLDENSIAAVSALRRAPVNIPDVRKDPRWNKNVDEQTKFVTRSILAVPMLRQGRLIGIIEVLNKRGGCAFTEEDVNVLLILSSLAAIAIENAQLYQRSLQAERLAALGQAVASVSHYIKNVLTGLKGSITLIESAVHDGDYHILDRAVNVLKRSYGRIAELVKDMLSFSKGRNPEQVPTDSNQVLLEIHDMLVESARTRGIEIATELEPDTPILLLDREVLEKVIMNFVENALEAVYERQQTDYQIEGRVTIRSRYRDGELSIEVEDNGVGIPEWELSKIWTAFYTTKGTSGTGLGLAVSKKLAEDVGGRVRAVSNPGQGATFVFTLPALAIESPDMLPTLDDERAPDSARPT
ncbi:MAG: Adaptive-response sensory-kinase SasA [bacterium]|nr:Adaptive-response sensory-kinase SasA [bacterium]